MQRIDRSIALAGWLGSDVCHENPCHENPCHIAYVLLSGVITSLHNKYSISYRHQHFHPFEVGIPPPPDHPTSNRFLREDPLVVASAATQEVGETVSYQKVIKRRRVPRATAKILHADRTLDFLVNPPSSCAQFHIYPRVAVPVRHSTILYNPFFCSATQHRPLAAESPCLSRCSGDR